MKNNHLFSTAHMLFLSLLFLLFASNSQAETVKFSLDNIFTTAGERMTGSFDWTYDLGDFENGSGQFTELSIPRYGTDITGLVITIDLSSIEFSLAGNFHATEANINLKLLTPLSLTEASLIDVSSNAGVYESKFNVSGFGQMPYQGGFLFGRIEPITAVPLPNAALLFASGLMLVGFKTFRKNKSSRV